MYRPPVRTPQISGGVYKVFRFLSDGRWHAASELNSLYGPSSTRAARSLRSPRFGSFNVQCAKYSDVKKHSSKVARKYSEGDTFYRITKEELRNRRGVVECMLKGRPASLEPKKHPADELRALYLTNEEIVLLAGYINRSGQMANEQVAALWRIVRCRVATKLEDKLDTYLKEPNDLFEEIQ